MKHISPRNEQVLRAINEEPNRKSTHYAEVLGMTRHNFNHNVYELRKAGFSIKKREVIVRSNDGKRILQRFWVYRVTEQTHKEQLAQQRAEETDRGVKVVGLLFLVLIFAILAVLTYLAQ